MREIGITDAVDGITDLGGDFDYEHFRVKMALYLTLISPDYAILK